MQAPRRAPRADNLDFKAAVLCRKFTGNVAEGYRSLHTVTIAPRGYRADHFAVVPDRFIATRVGVRGIDTKSEESQWCAALLGLHGRGAANEIGLL